MTTSRYYIKQLTSAELGEAKTHEKYIRLTNDFPYEEFFQTAGYQNGTVTQIDFTAYDKDNANEAISLKFIYYSNSNKEKRIPSIGNIFDARGVKVNDVVVLESVTTNGETKIYISFKNPDSITLSPSTIYYTIVNDERPHNFTKESQNLPLQQIFYGAPGTGKSFYVDGKTTDENSIRTTFHPDSDYASFVGAYKPIMAEMPMKVVPVVLNNGASFNQNEGTYSEKRITYKFVPQAFLKAYCNAWKNLDEPYYLVIEEINRGNCAQVFGDLFQLLDRNDQGYSSYAIEADEDIRRFISEDGEEYKLSSLQIEDVWNDDHSKLIAKGEDIANGAKLVLPKNLHIWATMNTSDQSLFPIDSAFKRRWDWEYMPIKYSNSAWLIDIAGVKYRWVDFQTEINKRIFDATESEDKQFGDYFVKADANNIISAKLLLNKVIFYLWNDVCKDGDGDIFKINTDLDYSKELDHSKDEDITFSQFFQGTDLKLQQWMHYLGIKPIEGSDEEQEEEKHLQEEGVKPADAKETTYSKPIYQALVESMLSQIDNMDKDVSIFQNGFDWAFTNMPGSYTRMSLSLDAPSRNKKATVKLWIPAPSGYKDSAACFKYLKEHNGENLVHNIAEKYNCSFEELGIHSANPNPVVGWKIIVPITFSEDNVEAESKLLMQIMSEMRSAFDPIITDFQKK